MWLWPCVGLSIAWLSSILLIVCILAHSQVAQPSDSGPKLCFQPQELPSTLPPSCALLSGLTHPQNRLRPALLHLGRTLLSHLAAALRLYAVLGISVKTGDGHGLLIVSV